MFLIFNLVAINLVVYEVQGSSSGRVAMTPLESGSVYIIFYNLVLDDDNCDGDKKVAKSDN